jgi:hypothetical protein
MSSLVVVVWESAGYKVTSTLLGVGGISSYAGAAALWWVGARASTFLETCLRSFQVYSFLAACNATDD